MMKNFLLPLLALSIVSIGLYQSLALIQSPYFFEYHPFIALFFFVVTFLFHKGLGESLAKSNQHFIRYFMGATGIKLMIIMLFVIIVALTNKALAMNFTLCTFFYYVFYSSFEVWISMKQFGRKS